MTIEQSKPLLFDANTIAARDYWNKSLNRTISPSNLPFDRQSDRAILNFNPLDNTSTTESIEGNLCPQLCESIQRLSSGGHFLIYTILVTGLHLCLKRYNTAQSNVTGSPSRTNVEQPSEANALPIVSDITDDMSFKQSLMHLRGKLLDAYQHQHYPWQKIAEDLGLETKNGNPLFDIGIRYTPIHTPFAEKINNDISFVIEPAELENGNQTLRFQLYYNKNTFSNARMALFLAHFETLLMNGLNTPNSPINELSMFSDHDRLFLEKHQSGLTQPLEHDSFIDFWSQRLNVHKDSIALETPTRQMSFEELDSVSNQLAQQLKQHIGHANPTIGIFFSPCCEMIIAILATLKVGGAFLPLDPDYPQDRLTFMINDAKCGLIINHAELANNAVLTDFQTQESPIEDLKISSHSRAQSPSQASTLPVNSDIKSLAYLIYTSGSTGQPKGVKVTHASLINLIDAQITDFNIDADSRILQFASFNFDASISEIFTSLCAGAQLVMVPRNDSMPGPDLANILEQYKITHITLTPSSLSQLTPPSTATDSGQTESGSTADSHSHLRAPTLTNLNTLIVAGEPCSANLAKSWSTGRTMINAYGPTEATVCTTLGVIEDNGLAPDIGKPIQNMSCRIVDQNLNDCPIGVPGELLISGLGLSAGYHQRDDLNIEKFTTLNDDSQTYYHSGDLAVWQANGRIRHLGRTDRQLKVRGMRIEAEEVEAALLTHNQVKQAVVVCQQVNESVNVSNGEEEHINDSNSGTESLTRLVAFICCIDDEGVVTNDIDTQALKQSLALTLPPFMLPDIIHPLSTIPQTHAGKIDYLVLEQLETTAKASEFVAPRDEVELVTARIWENLLERSPVGAKDDFFKLGGFSLLAVRLMSAIQQEFAVSLPLTTLFQHPTVEELAGQIRGAVEQQNQNTIEQWSPLVPIQKLGTKSPFFCIHPTGATVLCYYHLATQLGTDRPFTGIQARGIEPDQTPFTTIPEMVSFYADALCEAQPEGSFYLAGWSFGGVAVFELACQLQERGREIASLVLLDAYATDVFNDSFATHDDAEIISSLLGGIAEVTPESLRGLTTDEQLNLAIKATRDAQALPLGFSTEQAKRILTISKLNYHAVESYQPRLFSGQLTLIRPSGEKELAHNISPDDDTLGWSKWVSEGVQVKFVPGMHQTMLLPPNVEEAAIAIQSAINEKVETTRSNIINNIDSSADNLTQA